jgi:hypothetical protein
MYCMSAELVSPTATYIYEALVPILPAYIPSYPSKE